MLVMHRPSVTQNPEWSATQSLASGRTAKSCVVAKPHIYWASTSNFRLLSRPKNEETGGLIVFAEEDCGGEDGGPEAAFIAYGGLRDVHGADDLVGDSVDFFFFVPG